MKTALRALVCAALLGGSAAAAVSEDAGIIGFSTKGPDRYADGTTVLDGEVYALVWTRSGTAFAGFNVDGTLVDRDNASVLYAAPLAKGGRCESIKFVVDPLILKGWLANGVLSLHLLDTRAWAADGTAAVAGTTRVQGSTCVTEGVSVETTAAAPFASATGGTGEKPVYAASAVGTEVPSPKITGIRVEGDAVVLTVANTDGALDYAVSAGRTPGMRPAPSRARRRRGRSSSCACRATRTPRPNSSAWGAIRSTDFSKEG